MRISAKHSILDAADLLAQVIPLYQIPDVLSCEFWFMGLNHTYLVTAKEGNYVLRVYVKDWRTLPEIEFEVQSLLKLEESGCSVGSPIAKKDGGYICPVDAPEGIRYVIMTKWLQGKYPDFNDPDDARRLGSAIGRLHQASSAFKPSENDRHLNLAYLLDQPMDILLNHVSYPPQDRDFIINHARQLAAKVTAVAEQLEYGFCHGDFFGPNGYENANGFSFFDFDCCGFGYLASDLASFKASLLIRLGKPEYWPSFLEGYRSVRNLPELDAMMVDVFVAIFFIGRDSRGVAQYRDGYVGKELLNPDNYNRAMGMHKRMSAIYQQTDDPAG